MTEQMRCPVCGKFTPLGNLKGNDPGPEITVAEFTGLGRGKGFKIVSERAADPELKGLVAGRCLETAEEAGADFAPRDEVLSLKSMIEEEESKRKKAERRAERESKKLVKIDERIEIIEKVLDDLSKKIVEMEDKVEAFENDLGTKAVADISDKLLEGKEISQKEERRLPSFLKKIIDRILEGEDRMAELEYGQSEMKDALKGFGERIKEAKAESSYFSIDLMDMVQEAKIDELYDKLDDMERERIPEWVTMGKLGEGASDFEKGEDAAFTRGVVGGMVKVLGEGGVLDPEDVKEIFGWGFFARDLYRKLREED